LLASRSRLESKDIQFEFERTQYELRCASLTASMPDSQILAEGIILQPQAIDEEFFAAREFRRARIVLTVPQCRASKVAGADLLEGKGYRAEAIEVRGAILKSLIDLEKPLNPAPPEPFLWNAFLASIPKPVEIERASVRQGTIQLAERKEADEAPGVLSFDAVEISLDGIANRPDHNSPMRLQGECQLANMATLKLSIALRIHSPDFTFRSSGSLSSLDLIRLNPFLEGAAHMGIRSGKLEGASFEAEVEDGHARGTFNGIYHDLQIEFFDRVGKQGLLNRIKSILADHIKVRTSNAPQDGSSYKVGQISYSRMPHEQFVHFLWFAIRSGMLDLLGVKPKTKPPS
jgi:hypothetical protein